MATTNVTRAGPDWRAAVWAGVIAGAVFMMLEMILVPLFLGGSPWGPPRMIAAIVMGKGVLPPPATFAGGVFVAALVVHFVLSIAFALMLAAVIAGRTLGVALLAGAVFGLILYWVNFYLFTGIFPWFAMGRTWVSIFSHLVFGLVAAWTYMSLRRGQPVEGVV